MLYTKKWNFAATTAFLNLGFKKPVFSKHQFKGTNFIEPKPYFSRST